VYTASPNPGSSVRTAILTVGVQAVNVTQAAGACSYSLSSTGAFVALTSGTGTLAVTASAGCPRTAVSNDSWLTFTSGAAGSGTGTVGYSFAANPNATPRSGTLTIAGQPFTITQAGVPIAGPAPLRFVPVTPCRIADTRDPLGAFGGPALAGAISRDFDIPGGPCGIPANASAYSLNVSVVPLGPLSFLSLWPAGQPQPLVATLNSGDARIKGNAAIVAAGASGAITAFATQPTHLIIDINGYFVPAVGAQNLAFYPVTPCRVADTRNATGPLGGPTLGPGVARDFPVLSSPCGIPATAQAYAVNMTAVPPGVLGFLTTWPAGSPQPLVSTLNAPPGVVTANAAIVPAGPAGVNGAISVFASQATDLVIDINGYFAPPGAGSLDFFTTTPCRILDTRLPTGPLGGPLMGAGQSRSFPVPSSACGIPATARAYSMNATVVPVTILSFLTLWGSGGSQPLAATLNSGDGTVVGNAALVPAGALGAVTAFTTHASHLIFDINGYFQ
ncbi:MAG TPA: BACON domain-containing protein, partial [Candidatus Solibacter sp.]|nr:BACON domain-containing protein [Candidatus Solibacter sp.]